MSTPLRNELCPCGSGRKYKKCCIVADQKAATERLNQQRAEREKLDGERRESNQRNRAQLRDLLHGWLDDDGLAELSNSAVELIRNERFDEALAVCKRLLDEFPEVIDGLETSGTVHQKLGNHALAADFYRRCIAFIEQPSQKSNFEPDATDYYIARLNDMKQPLKPE